MGVDNPTISTHKVARGAQTSNAHGKKRAEQSRRPLIFRRIAEISKHVGYVRPLADSGFCLKRL